VADALLGRERSGLLTIMRVFAPMLFVSMCVACGTSDPSAAGAAAAVGGAAAVVPRPTQVAVPDAQVVSPRDAASGLATGKRQHKPVQ
jgi:hypothetical protein